MPYSYYQKLCPKDKKIYRDSDKIILVELQNTSEFSPCVKAIHQALKSEKKVHVQSATQNLATKITQQMNVAPVKIKVLASRPHNNYGEKHGPQ